MLYIKHLYSSEIFQAGLSRKEKRVMIDFFSLVIFF